MSTEPRHLTEKVPYLMWYCSGQSKLFFLLSETYGKGNAVSKSIWRE